MISSGDVSREPAAQPDLLQDEDPSRPGDTTPPAHGAAGHRARLRARLLKAGPDALADHEILEMLLFLAVPRRDTKPVAKELIRHFGSCAGAITAPAEALRGVEGLGEAGAAALKLVQAAALRLTRAEIAYRPVLNHWDRLIEYLTAVLAREKIEQVRVLFLDQRNRLIADEALTHGTVNHAPVYPREMMRRALELHATALILVHNHPSGDPTPSEDDVAMTREIKLAAATLSVVLHDHLIIGNGRWVSLKRLGLL